MTPEGEVKAEIKEGLHSVGVWPFADGRRHENVIGRYYMPVQSGFGRRAVDFIAVVRGKFVAIEAKRAEGGKLTKTQRNFLSETRDTGGVSIPARCWADVKEALEEEGLI